MVKYGGFSLQDVRRLTLGEMICLSDAVMLEREVENLIHQATLLTGAMITQEDRKKVLKEIELQIKELNRRYDNLEVN